MIGRARGFRPALLVLGIVLCVSLGSAGIVGATVGVEAGALGGPLIQQPAPNGTNTTSNATARNVTATPASNGSTGGGGFGFGIPSPSSIFEDMVGVLAGGLLAAGKGFVSTFNNFVFSLPAPGTPGDPSTWTSPENGLWPGIVDAMGYTLVLGVVLWVAAVARAFGVNDERERRASFRRCVYAGGAILLGLPGTAITLHITNGLIQGLAPDAAAFFATPSGVARLGVGLFAGLVLGIVQTGVVAVTMFALAVERVLVYLTVYLWPLAWGARAHGGLTKSLGETISYLFGVVVSLKLAQALIVRALFEIGVFAKGDGGQVLVTMLLTVAGLAFAFIILPKNMIRHANDAASVSLGMSAAQQQTKEHVEDSAERVRGEAVEKFQSYRERDTGGGAVDETTVGSVGSAGGSTTTESSSGDVGSYGATGGETPSQSSSPDVGIDDGIDADDWAKRRERMQFDSNRGFQ